jgi:hypothetical protein
MGSNCSNRMGKAWHGGETESCRQRPPEPQKSGHGEPGYFVGFHARAKLKSIGVQKYVGIKLKEMMPDRPMPDCYQPLNPGRRHCGRVLQAPFLCNRNQSLHRPGQDILRRLSIMAPKASRRRAQDTGQAAKGTKSSSLKEHAVLIKFFKTAEV